MSGTSITETRIRVLVGARVVYRGTFPQNGATPVDPTYSGATSALRTMEDVYAATTRGARVSPDLPNQEVFDRALHIFNDAVTSAETTRRLVRQ